MRSLLLGIAALVLLTVSASAAEPLKDVTVNGNKVRGVRNCAGGKAVLNGNKHLLILKNCKRVEINGNKHKVTLIGTQTLVVRGNKNVVSAGEVKSISVVGNRNTVTYTSSKPTVSNLGNNNRIRGK
jgi:hypothetical protein